MPDSTSRKPPELRPARREPPAPGSDRFLRACGFVIAARPADGPARWKDPLTGKVVDEALAHELAARRIKAAEGNP